MSRQIIFLFAAHHIGGGDEAALPDQAEDAGPEQVHQQLHLQIVKSYSQSHRYDKHNQILVTSQIVQT